MEMTMIRRWGTPAIGLVLGLLMFGASAVGGQPQLGLAMFAVMAVYTAVLLVFGDRSEMIGVLGGRPADERLASFDILATAVAGTVAILVAICGFLWSIAHGDSGSDFAVVAASAGIGYLGALAWFRFRG
jgi:hypothetical protein